MRLSQKEIELLIYKRHALLCELMYDLKSVTEIEGAFQLEHVAVGEATSTH